MAEGSRASGLKCSSPVRLLRYSTVNLIFFTRLCLLPLQGPLSSSPLLPKAAIPVSLRNQMAELAVAAVTEAVCVSENVDFEEGASRH